MVSRSARFTVCGLIPASCLSRLGLQRPGGPVSRPGSPLCLQRGREAPQAPAAKTSTDRPPVLAVAYRDHSPIGADLYTVTAGGTVTDFLHPFMT